ncbi:MULTISPECIES: hypothetical protein [unclassified Nodularia (in: cyanobacteria)]|uniref:hypothetical protein n=1 Tax=unclassified Nodularia (in: cyanobacteria) TaxID=2656917 RepID=UPI001882C46A|nr:MULTISPECIES: hypothetical protein [unclassified Nodularia (in: cyanobacteria)]MBE9199048.1 hypothetical protein [Nodularia sp. LEGE 06071]MCC2694050.1 hypothetical protein [Nodularia sp. LEGE 04288]
MKISWKFVAILSLSIALLPSPALANGGSALLWTGIIHLFIGNSVIGYIEGGMLSKWFHVPRGKATSILIIANYASAWGGMLLLAVVLSSNSMITIENIHNWLYIFWTIAFLFTLIIEYPFFSFLVRKQQNSWQTSVKATIIIHGISYFFLFGWYALTSYNSMLNQLDIVSAAQLQPKEEYVMYFINSEGNQAVRSNLQGKDQETIELSEFQAFVPEEVSNFGPVPQPNENTNWQYYLGMLSPAGGIAGYHKSENLSLKLNLETPLASWRVSHATHLEGDFVVFQLGDDQICILHPEQRKMALIARGSKPIVVKAQS